MDSLTCTLMELTRWMPSVPGMLSGEATLRKLALALEQRVNVRPPPRPGRPGRRHCSYANTADARRGGWGARLGGDGVSGAEEGEGRGSV